MLDRLAMSAAWLKAKAVAILAIAAGVMLLTGIAYIKGRGDGRAALQAKIDAATITATNRADADEHGRRDAADNRADAIEGAIRNATAANPEEVNRPAGPATSGVLNELRRRGR